MRNNKLNMCWCCGVPLVAKLFKCIEKWNKSVIYSGWLYLKQKLINLVTTSMAVGRRGEMGKGIL